MSGLGRNEDKVVFEGAGGKLIFRQVEGKLVFQGCEGGKLLFENSGGQLVFESGVRRDNRAEVVEEIEGEGHGDQAEEGGIGKGDTGEEAGEQALEGDDGLEVISSESEEDSQSDIDEETRGKRRRKNTHRSSQNKFPLGLMTPLQVKRWYLIEPIVSVEVESGRLKWSSMKMGHWLTCKECRKTMYMSEFKVNYLRRHLGREHQQAVRNGKENTKKNPPHHDTKEAVKKILELCKAEGENETGDSRGGGGAQPPGSRRPKRKYTPRKWIRFRPQDAIDMLAKTPEVGHPQLKSTETQTEETCDSPPRPTNFERLFGAAPPQPVVQRAASTSSQYYTGPSRLLGAAVAEIRRRLP